MSFVSYIEFIDFLDELIQDGYRLNGTDKLPKPDPSSRFFGVSWGVSKDGKCFSITERPDVYRHYTGTNLAWHAAAYYQAPR